MAITPVKPLPKVKALKTEGTKKTDKPLQRRGTKKTNKPRQFEGNIINKKK